jgi:hypothetical protein
MHIHTALYCGKTLEDVEERGNEIDRAACSDELQQKIGGTSDKASLLICYTCLAGICIVAEPDHSQQDESSPEVADDCDGGKNGVEDKAAEPGTTNDLMD